MIDSELDSLWHASAKDASTVNYVLFSLEAEAHLNTIKRFSSYLKENT
jgi:hypothetical protein